MLGTRSGRELEAHCVLSVLADWIVDRIRLERRSSVAGVFHQTDARFQAVTVDRLGPQHRGISSDRQARRWIGLCVTG